ncbi:MAG: beta-N-acetylhexosaminidase, partial [Lentisphaeria bacterium]|nr:beta-N-acetylhexosaminidase [Lentisphaeria bacterium]
MLLTAAILSAEVMPFANFTKNDVPVLVPAVRKYDARSGVFALPDTLSVALPRGEELVLEQLAAELKRFGRSAAAATEGNANCRFVLTEDGVPEPKEGYRLTVTPAGITVAAKTTSGLYFGAQTLRNLLRNAAAPELKACVVTDWPDFVRRGYFFSMAGRSGESLPVLKKLLDTITQLKINWVLVDFGASFPFADNPLTLRKKALTRAEALQFLKWCRERHIELTPTVQVWSHAQWMTYHPDWNKMKEGEPSRLWLSQPCPECAEAYELIRKSVNE